MAGVIFSSEAEQDLGTIGDYIARDNPGRAVSFLIELRTACQLLSEAHLRFSALQGFESKRYRRRIHGRYAIIYLAESDRVLIVRIMATEMDINEVFAEH